MTLRDMMIKKMRFWDGYFDGCPSLPADEYIRNLSYEDFLILYDEVRREYLEIEFSHNNESLTP